MDPIQSIYNIETLLGELIRMWSNYSLGIRLIIIISKSILTYPIGGWIATLSKYHLAVQWIQYNRSYNIETLLG